MLENIIKAVGGAAIIALIGLLLKHFIVAAPVTFQARRDDGAKLLADLTSRVASLESKVAELTTKLQSAQRERDALFYTNNDHVKALRLSAQMHRANQRPADAMLDDWEAALDSQTVVNSVPFLFGSVSSSSPVPNAPSTEGA